MQIGMETGLVIICGMAHSGTTIVAHILRQHPDFNLITNGLEKNLLENNFLLCNDIDKIKSLITQPYRTILKRPWVEARHTDWLIKNLPNAYYLYCLKSKDKIFESWSAENSNVNKFIRKYSKIEKNKLYDESLQSAMKLKENVKNFMIVENDELIINPHKVFRRINKFLNARDFTFDVSDVSATISIKSKLLSGDTIKPQNRNIKLL